jgi:homoserine O-succinyltransferase/O-acetyltransferase
MPVFLDRGKFKPRLFVANERKAVLPMNSEAIPKDCIEIALVNNMPDLALEQTERQILKLLDAAAGHHVVQLKLFAMSDLPRSEFGRAHLRKLHYHDVDDLSRTPVHAMIITGAEPRAPRLKAEPYWHSLTDVFDWANDNTVSTICSCLAVHAAVLHFDEIDRRTLKKKCFGVFEFEQVYHSRLLDGVAPRFQMPHSRLNQITEADLRSAGYAVLSMGDQGVDTFIKPKKSLFVFFQGHPEYEAWTLLGEYRRDIGRYLVGEQPDYPNVPAGYFDKQSISALNTFKTQALQCRQKDLMASFPTDQLSGRLTDHWRDNAAKIYANWLELIHAQTGKRKVNKDGLARLGLANGAARP